MKIIKEDEKHMDYFLVIFGNCCNIQETPVWGIQDSMDGPKTIFCYPLSEKK